jgi:hypothetical protein
VRHTLQDLKRKLDRIAKIRTKRLFTLAAMSIMALVLIAATACGSDPETAKPAAGGNEDAKISAQSTVETEPEQSASIGMPAPDAADTDEMIVVLDGALDLEDSPDTRLTDGELFVEGESRDGADPTTSDIRRMPDPLSDPAATDTDNDVPSILPVEEVKEVPDGSGLVSSGFVNPDNCDNVLPPPHEPMELRTRSATDPAKSDNPAINTMCMAWYAGPQDSESVTVALIAMNSDEAAIAHYELLKSEFSKQGIAFDEQTSLNRDWLTAAIDQEGMGTMVIYRIGSNLASVHNGPTSDQPVWDAGWMLDLADRVLEQLP